MNSRKDSRLQKEIAEEKYHSPGPCAKFMDVESLGIFLQDYSPYQAISGGLTSTGPNRISSADMKIINTPAYAVRKQSYLEQIDETYKQISGVIKWKDDHGIDSEDYQEEEYQGIDSQSDYYSEFQSEVPQADQHIQQAQNPQKLAKEKSLQLDQKCNELKEKLDKRTMPTTPGPEDKVPNGRKVFCNCKKTKCLKLYCDCFRDGQICGEGCNCQGCHNTESYEDMRTNSMWTLMQRNPDAFKPKIQSQQHTKGCHCKKSHCQKKYCQCFQAGLKCSEHCKCDQCKNVQQQQQGEKQQEKQEPINNTIRATVKKQRKFNQWRQAI